jgi:hypothetical protein
MIYLFSFIVGGIITTSIILLENIGLPLLSKIATLLPVYTWLSYIFFGIEKKDKFVVESAKFTTIGTLLVWVPYMLVIIYLTPKIGVYYSVLASLVVFVILAFIFSYFYR